MTAAATTVSARMKEAKNSERIRKKVFAEDASKAAPHASIVSIAMPDAHVYSPDALPNHSSDLPSAPSVEVSAAGPLVEVSVKFPVVEL